MAAPALRLVLTEAGIARFTAAQLGQPIDLSLASVGLSAAQIAVAPTLTALPGEFRRVATLSGKQVGRDVAHLIVRDEAALAYQVRGVGLFLADGTLFAVYAQAEPIVGKSIGSTMLLALDIAFPANSTAAIAFGNTDFLNPPATTEAKGVVELATDAEAAAGIDPSRVASILAMAGAVAGWIRTALDARLGAGAPTDWAKTLLAAATAGAGRTALGLGGAALKAADFYAEATRRITGAGLATGGGDHTADRTITVEAASAAEADAGTIATKAVTPASLANILTSILNRVPLTRRIDTGGLALGGDALSTDLTISVPAATAAQVRAGGASNAAITPAALREACPTTLAQNGSTTLASGLIFKWGRFTANANGTTAVGFAEAFPNACFVVTAGGVQGSGVDSKDNPPGVVAASITANGFSVFSADDSADACTFIAIGY